MMVLILYVAIEVPIVLAYQTDLTSWQTVIERVIDAMFALDILIACRTAYTDKRSDLLVTIPSRVLHRYLTSHFVVDLVSTIPFDAIVAGIAANVEPGTGSSARAVNLVRFTRLLRLLRLTRLLRLPSYLSSVSRLLLLRPSLAQIGVMVFQIYFSVHVLGCFFGFVASISEDPRAWWSPNIHPTVGMGEPAATNTASTASKYFAGLYFAIITASTTGYGDIVASNDAERAYMVLAMLLSVVVFGYAIGSIAGLWAEMNASNVRFQARMSQINTYIKQERLPTDLGRRLRVYYERYLQRRSAFDEEAILSELSDGLRREVVLVLNRDIIASIPFFSELAAPAHWSRSRSNSNNSSTGSLRRGPSLRSLYMSDSSFMYHLISLLKPQYAAVGEYVVHEGDAGIEMFFLASGQVEVLKNYSEEASLRAPRRRSSVAHRAATAARKLVTYLGRGHGKGADGARSASPVGTLGTVVPITSPPATAGSSTGATGAPPTARSPVAKRMSLHVELAGSRDETTLREADAVHTGEEEAAHATYLAERRQHSRRNSCPSNFSPKGFAPQESQQASLSNATDETTGSSPTLTVSTLHTPVSGEGGARRLTPGKQGKPLPRNTPRASRLYNPAVESMHGAVVLDAVHASSGGTSRRGQTSRLEASAAGPQAPSSLLHATAGATVHTGSVHLYSSTRVARGAPVAPGFRVLSSQCSEESLGVHVAFLSPGAYFGEIPAILGIPHTVSFRAATQATIFSLSRNSLKSLVDTYPSVGTKLDESIQAFLRRVK